jgi:four helix bundle protein
MARIDTFRQLEVWQLSMELVVVSYALTRSFPAEERYGLSREVRRSAVSIPSNIAEGHNRHGRNAYLNHVNIALGSQAELDCQMEIATRLGYVRAQDVREFAGMLERVGKMLHALQRSLEAKRVNV